MEWIDAFAACRSSRAMGLLSWVLHKEKGEIFSAAVGRGSFVAR